jgi:hypothetical protein
MWTMEKEPLFDFDTPLERRATASLKRDIYRNRDVIPLGGAGLSALFNGP